MKKTRLLNPKPFLANYSLALLNRILEPQVKKVGKISVRYEKFRLKRLADKDLPYTFARPIGLKPAYKLDEAGLVVYELNGSIYYNPVQLAEQAFNYLNAWRIKKKAEYLTKTEQYAAKILSLAIETKGSLFFPYDFDFHLHGLKGEEDTMTAPWVSGMAQGEALTLFSRLYRATKKPEYRQAAEKVFQSFLNLNGKDKLWISTVDKGGYYWIEEYPKEDANNTLNGFVFALFGLYDYYLATKDKLCQELLLAGLTTVKNSLYRFRNVGGPTYYCIKHLWKAPGYHKTHMDQFKMLTKITGDQYFLEAAKAFAKDYHV